jgi:hypothetical protein
MLQNCTLIYLQITTLDLFEKTKNDDLIGGRGSFMSNQLNIDQSNCVLAGGSGYVTQNIHYVFYFVNIWLFDI